MERTGCWRIDLVAADTYFFKDGMVVISFLFVLGTKGRMQPVVMAPLKMVPMVEGFLSQTRATFPLIFSFFLFVGVFAYLLPPRGILDCLRLKLFCSILPSCKVIVNVTQCQPVGTTDGGVGYFSFMHNCFKEILSTPAALDKIELAVKLGKNTVTQCFNLFFQASFLITKVLFCLGPIYFA